MTQKRIPLLPAVIGILLAIPFLWLLGRFYALGGNQRMIVPLLLLKTFGLGCSYLLVLGSLDAPVFNRFCPRGKWFDCHRVIESPAGKPLGLVHMADLGILYFGGSLLLLGWSACAGHLYHHIIYLGILNLAALLYTPFSVLYQALKVKKWCAICLLVLLVFWLEFSQFFPYLFQYPVQTQITPELLVPLLAFFALTGAIWLVIRLALGRIYRRPA